MRALLLAVLLAGCGAPVSSGEVYDALWRDFDARYALFDARGIDWDAADARWRPLAEAATDDDALFVALRGLLEETRDDHVYLARFTPEGGVARLVTAGRLGGEQRGSFDARLVHQRLRAPGSGGEGRLSWGLLDDDVAWLHLADFAGNAAGDLPDGWTRDARRALEALGSPRTVVVDVRHNGGGRAANALALAALFVQAPAPVFDVRTRAGPARDAFDAPVRWWVQPAAGHTAPQRVILLTDRFTMSAAETFTAALRTRGDVVQVGETTTGALSAKSHERTLPNGWAYTVSVQDFRDPDGSSPEGRGYAPHLAVKGRREDVAAEQDPVLDAALERARR